MFRVFLLSVCLFVVAACQPGGGYVAQSSDEGSDYGY